MAATELEIERFLEHHGVKGMKWGVITKGRSGGGQPSTKEATSGPTSRLGKRNLRINTERHTMLLARAAQSDLKISKLNAEIAALPSRSHYKRNKLLDKRQATIANRDKDLKKAKKPPGSGLTETQKKVLIGAAIVGVVIGYHQLHKTYDGETATAAIRRRQSQAKYGDVFKPKADLSGKLSPNEVLSKVSKDVNPNYGKPGGQMNCRRCTFTHELRRRGYDVQATTSPIGYGQNESGVVNAMIKGDKNLRSTSSVSKFASNGTDTGLRTRAVRGDTRQYVADTGRIQRPNTRSIRETLSGHPPGARGEILFDMGGFAHSMSWENFDGVPHIFDSQKGVHYPVTERGIAALTGKWGIPNVAEVTRLDNVDLDLEFLSRWSTNRQG